MEARAIEQLDADLRAQYGDEHGLDEAERQMLALSEDELNTLAENDYAQQILDDCFHNDMSTEPCAACYRKAYALDEPTLALTYTADEAMENILDAERDGDRAPEILTFDGSRSPWVKRNLDCAQYAQPRGSQYEGQR